MTRFLTLLFLTGAMTLRAQTAVQKPTSPSSWKISYAPAVAASGAAPVQPLSLARAAETTYTISGSAARIETRYDDNTVKTAYYVNGEELSKNSKTNRIRWLKSLEQTPAEASCLTVYPGFDWVADKYLVGKQKINNQACLHYRLSEDTGTASVGQEAWVAENERLPVAFLRSGLKGTYTFLEKPKAAIQIPQEFLDYRNSLMRKPQ